MKLSYYELLNLIFRLCWYNYRVLVLLYKDSQGGPKISCRGPPATGSFMLFFLRQLQTLRFFLPAHVRPCPAGARPVPARCPLGARCVGSQCGGPKLNQMEPKLIQHGSTTLLKCHPTIDAEKIKAFMPKRIVTWFKIIVWVLGSKRRVGRYVLLLLLLWSRWCRAPGSGQQSPTYRVVSALSTARRRCQWREARNLRKFSF